MVTRLATDLGPLEHDFEEHEQVHRYDAKPKKPSLPPIAESQESDSEGRFCQCLAKKGAAGGDIYQNVHPVAPFLRGIFENVPGRELVHDQAIVGKKKSLHGS